MPEVSYEIKGEGFAKLVNEFNQLTKAEQRAAVQASKISGELSKSGRKSGEFRKLARGALEFAGALGAVTSVQQVISAGFQEVQRQVRETINLAKQAQNLGRNLEQGRGQILANDPNLTAAQRARIDGALRSIAPQLGKQGAQQAGKLFADVRTGTPGASLDQQIAAFRTAARTTALTGVDDLSQLAPQAIANVRIQQALGKQGLQADGTTAQNLLLTGGARAGIDTGQVAKNLLPLIGAEGATVAQKTALLGFGTAETGLGGERIGTAIQSLLQRLARPEFKDGATGTSFTLQGDTQFGKLTNFLDRVQGGQLDRAAAQRALAGDDAGKNALLNALFANRGTFNETLGLASGSLAGGRNLQEETIAAALSDTPQLARTLKTRTAEGQSVFRQAANVQGRGAAEVADAIKATREGLGVISPFKETLPLLGLEAQAQRASTKAGGLAAFERQKRIEAFASAFGIENIAGGGRGGVVSEAALKGATRTNRLGAALDAGGEAAAFQFAVNEGFVSPDQGLSGAERVALSAGGISDEQLNKLARLFEEGQEKAFRKVFQELIKQVNFGPKAQDLGN